MTKCPPADHCDGIRLEDDVVEPFAKQRCNRADDQQKKGGKQQLATVTRPELTGTDCRQYIDQPGRIADQPDFKDRADGGQRQTGGGDVAERFQCIEDEWPNPIGRRLFGIGLERIGQLFEATKHEAIAYSKPLAQI